jgi:hypothetical protein
MVLPPALMGVYLNPDDIEAEARANRILDPARYGVRASGRELLDYLLASEFLRQAGREALVRSLAVAGSGLRTPDIRRRRITLSLGIGGRSSIMVKFSLPTFKMSHGRSGPLGLVGSPAFHHDGNQQDAPPLSPSAAQFGDRANSRAASMLERETSHHAQIKRRNEPRHLLFRCNRTLERERFPSAPKAASSMAR